MGTSSWDEIHPQVSVDADCDSGLEDQWLTQQMHLNGSREALAGTESAVALSAAAQSAAAEPVGAQSVAALTAAAQSAGKCGAAHGVQSASAAPSQSPVNTECFCDSADQQHNMKRPRRGLSNQQPAQAGSDVQQQVAPSCRNAASSAAGLVGCQPTSVACEGGQRDRFQQGSMVCEGDQQASWQGQPHSEGHEQGQSSEVDAPKDSVQQSPTRAAGVRKGVERKAPRLQSLLMRLIDDFLFITPSRTAAEALVNKLLKGAQLTAPCLALITWNHLIYRKLS